MKVIIRTPVSQKRLMVENAEDLKMKIQQSFKIDKYELFSNPERTIAFKDKDLKDNIMLYMSYQMKEPEVYKEENKCTHSPEAVCPKCATLDPLDKSRDTGIKVKYLSYDSYKEMLKNNNKSEDVFNYKLRVCSEHPSNVRCMKCMEKVITLVPQIYRRVDYVEFDNIACMETMIKKWRESMRQRIGLLVGKYKPYEDTPNGIKAVVSGIWEVKQENFPDGAVFSGELPEKFLSDEFEILGVIYTDLFVVNKEMYSYKRDLDYIVSNVELSFYYELRKHFNNPRFVNICITVNEEKEIAPECYMISEQFIALMEAEALRTTTDPAHFETNRDITYLIRNEYKKDVPIKAKPFVPVDYFIVKCEVGGKENSPFKTYTVIDKVNPKKLSGYFEGDYSMDKFSDFNILVYLSKNIPVGGIFKAILNDDKELFKNEMEKKEIVEFLSSLSKYSEKKWSCTACTFLNEAFEENCQMCGAHK